METKEKFMRRALAVAKRAAAKGEVPVGAVIVKDGEVVATGCNMKERKNCALYHAETVAIARACKKLGNWYLDGCEMYVTLEPCAMCAGALINSRLDKLYFGAYDPKGGCCGSICDLPSDRRFNHRLRQYMRPAERQTFQSPPRGRGRNFARGVRSGAHTVFPRASGG